MPGLDFPIPISRLNGVRIAVPETDLGMRTSAKKRLEQVLKNVKDKPTAAIQLQSILNASGNKIEPPEPKFKITSKTHSLSYKNSVNDNTKTQL